MFYGFDWRVLWEYRDNLLTGLTLTLEVSAVSMVLSLALGIVIGVGRFSRITIIRFFCAAFVEFFRNVHLIVLLFFFYFAVRLHSFPAAVCGLTAYTAAFISETVRSGIQSVPKGNFEAAKSTGLSLLQTVRYVVLPHAFMVTIPSLTNEFLNVVKNSSIAMTIAVTELTFQTQEIDSLTFRGVEAATAVTLMYLSITLVITAVMAIIEKKVVLYKRVG